jgi:hypothetical protein
MIAAICVLLSSMDGLTEPEGTPTTDMESSPVPPVLAAIRPGIVVHDPRVLQTFSPTQPLRAAFRLTPGIVLGPGGQVYAHGTPMGEGSLLLDGSPIMGSPRAFP